MCFFLTRAITSPIQKLTAGAKTIASGEYDYRIDNPSHDEIGELLANPPGWLVDERETHRKVLEEEARLRSKQ